MAVSQICEVLPTGFNDKDPQADGTVLALNAAARRCQDRRCRKKLSQLCSRVRTSRIKFSACFRQQGAVQSLLVCCKFKSYSGCAWKVTPMLTPSCEQASDSPRFRISSFGSSWQIVTGHVKVDQKLHIEHMQST